MLDSKISYVFILRCNINCATNTQTHKNKHTKHKTQNKTRKERYTNNEKWVESVILDNAWNAIKNQNTNNKMQQKLQSLNDSHYIDKINKQ